MQNVFYSTITVSLSIPSSSPRDRVGRPSSASASAMTLADTSVNLLNWKKTTATKSPADQNKRLIYPRMSMNSCFCVYECVQTSIKFRNLDKITIPPSASV